MLDEIGYITNLWKPASPLTIDERDAEMIDRELSRMIYAGA